MQKPKNILSLISLGLLALFSFLPSRLSAANQAENFKDGSVYVSNPSPCLGQTITLFATVLNTDYPTDGAGQVDIKAEMVGSSSYPGCGTSTTTVLANRWWVVYNSTTGTTPATPATDYNSIGQGGNGYQISGLPSGNPTWSTEQIQVPILISNTAAALGSNYLMVYLKGNYVDPTSATGFDDEVCIPLNIGSTGCAAPAPSGNLYKRVVGTAGNGNIMVYWLDYNFFNDTNLTITDAIPACETILAYAPNPKDGSMPTPAGNSITWTLPDASATSTPYPLESQGSVWVEVQVGAGCTYPLNNTATYAGANGLAGSSNTLSQDDGQNIILTKQEFDVNYNPISSASNVTKGAGINYVLQYNISGQVLKCFDPFNYTAGTATPAANASPSWSTGGLWMADSQTGSQGATQWNIVSYSGDRALQFIPVNTNDYRCLFYTCSAASAQVAACTNVEIISDVRLDDATNQGQDVGIWVQNDNATCASGYMLVLSGDANAGAAANSHMAIQRNNGTCGSGCCNWTGCCPTSTFFSGQWYTADVLETKPGVIYAKFWQRGTPEPVGWMLSYSDGTPLACPGASNHIGLGGQGAKTEFDNFHVVVPVAVTNASVWDTVPASIGFQSTAPAATGQPGVGTSGGLIHWDFTGSNFGAIAGVLYAGQGSFTWTGVAECPAGSPVLNNGMIGGVIGAAAMQSSSNTVTLNINCGGTPTDTPTSTVTPTSTSTRTPTPTYTATPTQTDTATQTDTVTQSDTPTPSSTQSDTPTQTDTATQTDTKTCTATQTDTVTIGPSPTDTVTSTVTPTYSATPTATDTRTATPTSTQTITFTATFTATPTSTITFTRTITPIATFTDTPTYTDTPSVTETPSSTSTQTVTSTITFTRTETVTATPTPTFSDTKTATDTRTETATRTASATVTVSPTITLTPVPMPFELTVTIYNSAGEMVRGLYNGPIAVLPTSINLSSSSSPDGNILATGGTLTLSLPGQLGASGSSSLAWNGTNDQSQPVSDGVYTFQLQMVDQYGHISTLDQQVTVMDTQGQNELAVYNSAGELVYRELLTRFNSSIVSFTVKHAAFVGAFDSSGSPLTGSGLQITYKDINDSPYADTWYGVGMDGQALSSGVYTVQLLRTVGTSTSILESQQVTLIRRGPQVGSGAHVAPNPIMGGGMAVLSFSPSIGAIAQAQVFSLASERVLIKSGPSESGQLAIDTSHLAPGVYVIEFTKVQNNSVIVRTLVKMAIIR